MPEQTVWRGTSSQWKNLGAFVSWSIAAILVLCFSIILWGAASGSLAMLARFLPLLILVPIGMMLSRYLITRSKVYELTTERLKISEGVFSKTTNTLELYRVKDIETRQPFVNRLVGVENVRLTTSDASSPLILIEAIPRSVGLSDLIRNQVETIRQQRGVRELDVDRVDDSGAL
ncbi:MAG TPA: PH domain-containing protein [Chthoniobacterales bacterium]|nr:PH domain-containing protein [Chthoniobacterales bacterium]